MLEGDRAVLLIELIHLAAGYGVRCVRQSHLAVVHRRLSKTTDEHGYSDGKSGDGQNVSGGIHGVLCISASLWREDAEPSNAG